MLCCRNSSARMPLLDSLPCSAFKFACPESALYRKYNRARQMRCTTFVHHVSVYGNVFLHIC